MYEAHYALNTLPFENTADPRFFYASEQHREALSAIEYTIRLRKGIVLITGDIGSGKTTVGRTMIDRCGKQITLVQVQHSHHSALQLVRQVLRNLGAKLDGQEDHSTLIEMLQRVMHQHVRQGRPLVIFVDEAQTLSDEALEELRLLSNFDHGTMKLVQIVVIGQPELRDRLRQPGMAAFRQRVFMAKQLFPLTINETAGYIVHRIRAASERPERPGVKFNGDAIRAIHGFARGTPRLINVVCDNCLLLGYVKQVQEVSGAMAQQVIGEMVPSFDQGIEATGRNVPGIGPAAQSDFTGLQGLSLAG